MFPLVLDPHGSQGGGFTRISRIFTNGSQAPLKCRMQNAKVVGAEKYLFCAANPGGCTRHQVQNEEWRMKRSSGEGVLTRGYYQVTLSRVLCEKTGSVV